MDTQTNIDYEKLATFIAARLALEPPFEDQLWTPEQCANYLSVSTHTFLYRIAPMPGFPAPARIGTTETKVHKKRLWFAADIVAYARRTKRA